MNTKNDTHDLFQWRFVVSTKIAGAHVLCRPLSTDSFVLCFFTLAKTFRHAKYVVRKLNNMNGVCLYSGVKKLALSHLAAPTGVVL